MKRTALLLSLVAALFLALAASAAWSPPLHYGVHGKRVRTAQYLLKGHNHFKLHTFHRPITGFYGTRTVSAAAAAKYRLGYPKPIRGNFPASLYELLTAKTKLPARYLSRRQLRGYAWPARIGAIGPTVRAAQYLMEGHNRFHLRTFAHPVTGHYRAPTAAATWWAKYELGYPRPIFGRSFGHQLERYLQHDKLPADYLARRVARRRVPPRHTLAGFAHFARTTVGTAYRWGGTNPFIGGADCSGLTQFLYSRYWGINLPRTTYSQVYAGRYESRPSRIGDLIFFGWPPHHVAMYMGGGQMIEDPHTGATVRIVPVRSYSTVRRILSDNVPYGLAFHSERASAGPSGLPLWAVALSVLGSLLLSLGAVRLFLRRVARKAAHEVAGLAEDLEEALDEHPRP